MQQKTPNIATTEMVGKEVTLKGWVHARRDMGKIIFIDLRDSTGLVQVVFAPGETEESAMEAVKDVRGEFVLGITGTVQKRGKKQINEDMETGTVEVLAKELEVINQAKTPPFELDKDTSEVGDETRLKYRYLDLRSERMRKNLKGRQQIFHFVRNHLAELGFFEIQTPILTKSTPEGARDYLVPSRMHKGQFFALPQSPQQYKQMLMVAGFEKYFQIPPCFRDEDARADRSPGEFYQIDIEMSFVTQEDILNLTETMFTKMVKELFPQKKITKEPWPRITYEESMKKYGTDKPDLRKDKKDKDELAFTWVVDFPLFTPQTEGDFFHGAGDKCAPSHHMFTAPKEEDVHLLDTDPLKARSYQHDLALNGVEVGGGSVRIHDPKVQEKIFDLIGFDKEDKKKFYHLLEAFKYGVPPHGGIAPGLDRLVRILMGEDYIREVIAFPLSGDVRDPMMGSPSDVSKGQLKELGIDVKKK